MTTRAKLKRKSYFVDQRALNRAKKALGVKTEAEVIRLSIERVAEMEEFWQWSCQSFGAVLVGVTPNDSSPAFFELATVRWEPSVADWWEAGRLVRNIGDKQDWDIHKRRDFQNDALIALTVRRHEATVVTADSSDFELLRSELRISVLPA